MVETASCPPDQHSGLLTSDDPAVLELLGPCVPNSQGYPHFKQAKCNGATTLHSLVGLPKLKPSKKLTAYLNKATSRSLDADALLGRHAPMRWDGAHMALSERMQDLMTECGIRRSLQTNIADQHNHCNVNMLRHKRSQTNLEHLHLDGGWQYSATVSCIGNWVEERHDPSFQGSGFHARELGLSQIYNTEHNDKFLPLTEEYKAKVRSEHAVAKFPKSKFKKGNESDERLIYYSAGFGDAATLDHTEPSKRGGYWLGTAPVKSHETVAMTTAKQETLEFQKRCPMIDPKANILGNIKPLDMTDGGTRHAMKSLQQSQQHTATWHSTYGVDFKDRSRHAISIPAQQTTLELPQIHRPNS